MLPARHRASRTCCTTIPSRRATSALRRRSVAGGRCARRTDDQRAFVHARVPGERRGGTTVYELVDHKKTRAAPGRDGASRASGSGRLLTRSVSRCLCAPPRRSTLARPRAEAAQSAAGDAADCADDEDVADACVRRHTPHHYDTSSSIIEDLADARVRQTHTRYRRTSSSIIEDVTDARRQHTRHHHTRHRSSQCVRTKDMADARPFGASSPLQRIIADSDAFP